jgi:hypothetical protein
MIGYLWELLTWRRITGAYVTYDPVGDIGRLLVIPGRWRRWITVELSREEWVMLAKTIVDGEPDATQPDRCRELAAWLVSREAVWLDPYRTVERQTETLRKVIARAREALGAEEGVA